MEHLQDYVNVAAKIVYDANGNYPEECVCVAIGHNENDDDDDNDMTMEVLMTLKSMTKMLLRMKKESLMMMKRRVITSIISALVSFTSKLERWLINVKELQSLKQYVWVVSTFCL